MTGLTFSDTERNPLLQQYGGDFLPTTYGETLSAAIGDPLLRPTQMLSREAELTRAEGFEPDYTSPVPAFKSLPDAEQFESAEKLNEEYGYLGLKFDEPMHPDRAAIMADGKRAERRRQDIIRRGPQGILPATGRFVASFLGAAVDPINVASAFIPVAREARLAGALARVGQRSVFAQRAATGAIEGFAGAALVEPVVYGTAKSQQLDYTMADALMNLAIGTTLGAGLHPAAGKLGDYLKSRSPDVRDAALKKAVADAVEGRSIDVDDVMNVGEAEKLNIQTRDAPEVSMTTRDALDSHADTSKAKNGSIPAARRVVEDLGQDMDAPPLPPDYEIVAVHPPGQGRDKLPDALAEKFAEDTGGTIVGDFSVTRAKDGSLRVKGQVKEGKQYLLTADGDDASDAIAAMHSHINEGGGHVAVVMHAIKPGDDPTRMARLKRDPFAAKPGDRATKPAKVDDGGAKIIDDLARKIAEKDLDPRRDATADFDAAQDVDQALADVGDDPRAASADIDEDLEMVELTDEESAILAQADEDIARAESSTDAVMEAAACVLRNTP